jgi:hypothetical protein
MLLLFALTLFTSATLLFMVEPMIAKMILPLLGGTPAVWNTCMVFFQAVLLAGYAYAHFSTTWLGPRKQAVLHLFLLALPFVVLPLTIDRDLIKGGENPIFGLLLLLSLTVGLPMFVVSASAPLLQKWFASTSHPAARDPYFLYGASNLGSMLALIAYPTVVEPHLRLGQQSFDWTIGYGVLAALTALCAVFLWRSPANVETSENLWSGGHQPPEHEKSQRADAPRSGKSTSIQPSKQGIRRDRKESRPARSERPAEPSSQHTLSGDVTWPRVLRWLALAIVPSSLMLGATTYITTDIAAIPWLWVAPLALYLLSFIIVFSHVPSWLQWVVLTIAGTVIAVLLWMMLWNLERLAGHSVAQLLIRIGLVLATGFGIFGVGWGWKNRAPDMLHFAMVLVMPLLVLAMLFFMLAPDVKTPSHWIAVVLTLHLTTLFVVSMVCHGELARDRPAAKHLTAFFLWMSVGGVLGGLFNALVAPLIFNGIAEYQLALLLACFLAPALSSTKATVWGRRFDMILAGLFLVIGLALIFSRILDHDLTYSPTDRSPWPWLAGALIVGLGIGIAAILRGEEQKFDRGMDLLLPLSLGTLLIGLAWGLQSNLVGGRLISIARAVHFAPAYVRLVLTFGAPLALAYTFVERPLRFALGVGALLLAGAFCDVFSSNISTTKVIHQERSFFGVLKIADSRFDYPPRHRITDESLSELRKDGVPEEVCRKLLPLRSARFTARHVFLRQLEEALDENELKRYRSIILEDADFSEGDEYLYRSLNHGTTLHGTEYFEPEEMRGKAVSYYHPTGPMGELMMVYNGADTPPEKMNVAVIGLGTGSMATFARKGQHLTFYDIDPVVKRLSFDPKVGDSPYPFFTFVQDARDRGANMELVMGDARLTMEKKQLKDSEKYGVIVVDAFSSDAIPIHLITREAVQVFLDKLTDDGLLCFHISNRYLDLKPVLYNLARERNLSAVYQNDNRDDDDRTPALFGKTSSTWVILSRSGERLNKLRDLNDWEEKRQAVCWELLQASQLPDRGTGLVGQAILMRNLLDDQWCRRPAQWLELEPNEDWPDLKTVGVWTDDYSNLFSVFSWR